MNILLELDRRQKKEQDQNAELQQRKSCQTPVDQTRHLGDEGKTPKTPNNKVTQEEDNFTLPKSKHTARNVTKKPPDSPPPIVAMKRHRYTITYDPEDNTKRTPCKITSHEIFQELADKGYPIHNVRQLFKTSFQDGSRLKTAIPTRNLQDASRYRQCPVYKEYSIQEESTRQGYHNTPPKHHFKKQSQKNLQKSPLQHQ
ncbi:hypothetical protein L9F63_006563, partial [Diploptera punctata]